jgi:methylenetetrahydrofolate--tRNA-(uracil-5-)-methyltransferase
MSKKVLVIGAGLAGSEAAWFLAERGIQVILAEGKSLQLNPAQKIRTCAELVCTNSLKSKAPDSAHGMLKHEMHAFGSLVLQMAELTAVPAGDALAVDRDLFSEKITQKLKNHPLINFIEREIENPFQIKEEFAADYIICASGPLTTSPLEKWIQENISLDDFYFYDAIAPVVDADTLDYSKLYFKDRHKTAVNGEEITADYLNSHMTQEQYEHFIHELVNAEKTPPKNFENYKFFESCLPIDTMAERGVETARFSCMKPIGLELPDGSMPYACVQLRKENLLGSAYNLVGFQTRLTHKEQMRVFRLIPGLEEASFIHLGSVHRNSFLNARTLLNSDLSTKKYSDFYFAGQLTGVEGYTESASMGIYAALQIFRRINNLAPVVFPLETAMGSLVNYIMTAHKPVPSNINLGLMPGVEFTKEQRKRRKEKKKIKKEIVSTRAREVFDQFYKDNLC